MMFDIFGGLDWNLRLPVISSAILALSFDASICSADLASEAAAAATLEANEIVEEVKNAPEAAASENKQEEKDTTTGADLSSDYSSKHFSLTAGFIVLNQWKLKDTTPAELETGDTGANGMLETGFRYRWAWLDRSAVRSSLPSIVDVAKGRLGRAHVEMKSAAVALEDLEPSLRSSWDRDCDGDNPSSSKQDGDLQFDLQIERFVLACAAVANGEAAVLNAATRVEKARRQLIAARSELALKQNALDRATLAEQRAKLVGTTDDSASQLLLVARFTAEAGVVPARANVEALELALGGLEHSVAYWRSKRGEPTYYGVFGDTRRDTEGLAVLIPDDWGVRMGYAFSGSSDDVAAIAGASDLYIDLDFGWNLAQWTMRTASVEEVPIRGSINLEVGLSWDSDSQNLDVHQRTLVGMSAVFGIPLAPRQTGKAAVPIAEIVARIGAVHAETPKFINSSNTQIRLDNGLVDFEDGWGVGMDVEVNLPVPGDFGYVVLRGRLNSGFDPNPWAITIGYTIPIRRLFGSLTGGGKIN